MHSASTVRQLAIDARGRLVAAGQIFDDDFGIREDTGKPYPRTRAPRNSR